MKSKKATKRALLTSAMSLVLCFAMLLGTTFAWFTDEASTAVNTIQSGTLDVDLVDTDGKTLVNQTLEFVKAEGASADEAFLWEPGCTYVTEGFQVENLGNLWLKYQLVINGIDGDSELLDVIDFWITDNVETLDKAVELGTYLGDLAPETKSGVYYLVGHMKEDAGNEYQGLTIEGVGITVYATQKDAEYDSFGPNYDTDAVHPDTTYFNSYSFDKESDLLAFAPTAGDAASSGLSITADGKAQIEAPGAWYTIDADLAANEYIVEYDIDITNVTIGEYVTVDTGDGVTWGSTPITLERGSTKVYYGISKNEYIDTLEGTVVHVTHTYSYNSENKLVIATTVSDGVATVEYSKAVASAAKTTLYWDIYYATDAGKATMDNFTVKGVRAKVDTAEELASALENNMSVKLAGDIELTGEWTPIGDKDAGVYYTGTLDGAGHKITGLNVGANDYDALISAAKDATIKNLTVEGTVNGVNAAGIVARVEGNTVIENCVSNVTVTGTTKAGGIACNVTGADAKIINCVNNGAVSGTGTAGLGGMIGYVNNDAAVEIISCTNNGAVNGSNVATQYAGAVIGYAAGTSKGTISNFTNTGEITGKFNEDTRYLKDAAGTYLAGYCATPDNWDVLVADENGLVVQYSGEAVVLYDVTSFEGDTLVIPEGVTTIGGYAFAYNTNIDTIVLAKSVTKLNDRAFRDTSASTVILNEGLTNISYQAFRNATNVTSVEIPSTVTTISKEAFQNSGITTLTIPANVTTIEYGGCRDMKMLEHVVIEGNVEIPVYAFRACTNLKTVTLKGDNVTFAGRGMIFTNKENGDGSAITVMVANETVKDRLLAADTAAKDYGGYTILVGYSGASTAGELATALAAGENVALTADISCDAGIVIPEGGSLNGNGHTITYNGTDYDYHLVKLSTGAAIENVKLENYRVQTTAETNGVVTMKDVVISMDNDQTGLDISRGAGTAKLTNVECKSITDAAHLNPATQVQVDYTPYGDVLLGTTWGLEATDCTFGSLHGWNTTNGSNVSLTNTTCTVFRMHYWSNRTLYIDGVETAWSESGAIPVAHDVGGCWSVQPAFK